MANVVKRAPTAEALLSARAAERGKERDAAIAAADRIEPRAHSDRDPQAQGAPLLALDKLAMADQRPS
jgi:hypothetical protein